jgi:hypothetical protein
MDKYNMGLGDPKFDRKEDAKPNVYRDIFMVGLPQWVSDSVVRQEEIEFGAR